MNRKPSFSLAAALVLAATATLAQSQSAAPSPGAMTRQEVKIERDEFMRSHQWDNAYGNWVLKP